MPSLASLIPPPPRVQNLVTRIPSYQKAHWFRRTGQRPLRCDEKELSLDVPLLPLHSEYYVNSFEQREERQETGGHEL